MAGMKNAYRFLASAPAAEAGYEDDFDESDVWGFMPDSRLEEHRKPIPASRSARKKAEKGDRSGGGSAAASLPMNIPDWSKILKEENQDRGVASGGRGRQFFEHEGDDEDETENGLVIPPHELLWRRRTASFSVQEGVGRTLKGRDLSRVRDAIWQRTGFED